MLKTYIFSKSVHLLGKIFTKLFRNGLSISTERFKLSVRIHKRYKFYETKFFIKGVNIQITWKCFHKRFKLCHKMCNFWFWKRCKSYKRYFTTGVTSQNGCKFLRNGGNFKKRCNCFHKGCKFCHTKCNFCFQKRCKFY